MKMPKRPDVGRKLMRGLQFSTDVAKFMDISTVLLTHSKELSM